MLYSVHPLKGTFATENLVSTRGKMLSYIALGLRLRALPADTLLHAHGASGYGLSAMLSGRSYIATVYGSEILRPHGFAYSRMVDAVLRNASAITVTSADAKARIVRKSPTVGMKTHYFHTGLDTQQTALIRRSGAHGSGETLKIMLLRNTAAHYRTREVLVAVAQAIGDQKNKRVIVPLGNGDETYFNDLRREFNDSRFIFIDRPCDHQEYMQMMSDSDVCINFPVSDQTSATLLEALYFDRVVVTNRLASYADLTSVVEKTGDWFFVDSDDQLTSRITQAIARAEKPQEGVRKGRDLISEHFSIERASCLFNEILEELR
ncbi:hypothetical protein [Sphingobium sp. CFD-2]|uniref:hypothetical protein n=1 Tax=Sphingobium sp. CFD-2 TaxID=2878542 RepID=UPI00214C7A8B|nr:hypothetical protein [Sphingobium sp. CFD-2]